MLSKRTSAQGGHEGKERLGGISALDPMAGTAGGAGTFGDRRGVRRGTGARCSLVRGEAATAAVAISSSPTPQRAGAVAGTSSPTVDAEVGTDRGGEGRLITHPKR